MKRYPPTQDDVIGAFLRWVNADRGAAYDVAKRPDEANRNEQDIDYVLTDPKRTPEIAVEVSSVWRSEEAGKEDAFFAKWFGRVRTRIQGRIAGTFYVFFSPIRVPDRLDPERFGNDLLGVMEREYYNPTLQRFPSEDPVGFLAGLNVYTYVGNNPIEFRDSLGPLCHL